MRTKKFRAVAMIAALAMLLSVMTVLFAACKKSSNEEQTPTVGTTGVGTLVSDEDLVSGGKLKAMYTFEGENGKGTAQAINPYTGEEQSANDATYSSTGATIVANPDADTKDQSGSALSVRDGGITLGKLTSEQLSDASEGLSISFWAYNTGLDTTTSSETNGTLAFDFMNIVGDGSTTITWGNVRGSAGDLYPDSSTVVGRGAYTDDSYAEARQVKTDEQLALFDSTYTYTGWNAIAGSIQGATEGDVVYDIAQSYQNTWRYVTIVVDEDDGILFYANGRLAYQYTASRFAVSSFGSSWKNAFEGIMLSIMEEGGTEYLLGMFSDTIYLDDVDVYVDDIIVGTALTATEAQALYENLSGVTYTADDIALTSTLGAEEAEKAAAAEAKIAELIANLPVEGDTWGDATDASASVTRDDTGVSDGGTKGSISIGTAGDGIIADSTYDARAAFLETYDAANYREVLGSVGTAESGPSGSYSNQGSSATYTPTLNSDGTFEMVFSGVQLAQGTGNWQGVNVATFIDGTYSGMTTRQDWYVNGSSTSFTTEISGNIPWFESVTNGIYVCVFSRYCLVDITIKYDGTNVSITYDIYYWFVGETFTLTTASGVQFDYTIAKTDSDVKAASITYTLSPTATGGFDGSAFTFRLGVDGSAYLITDFTGGTSSADQG